MEKTAQDRRIEEKSTLVMSSIVMGYNDSQFCLHGWHALGVGLAGLSARWTSEQASVRLKLSGEPTVLFMLTCMPPVVFERQPYIAVYERDRCLGRVPWVGSTLSWTLTQIPISLFIGGKAGEAVISLCPELRVKHDPDEFSPFYFIPHETQGNGDFRKLGISVAALRVA
jgi:hypothetical protein